MHRFFLAPVLLVLVLACASGGTDNGASTPEPRLDEHTDPSRDDASAPIRPPPGAIASVNCPATPFQTYGDQPTHLAFCERLAWHVSRCELQGPADMTADQQCRLVTEQDKLRARLQRECLEREVSPDEASGQYRTLLDCVSPDLGEGKYKVTNCEEALPCLQSAGIDW